jgi:sulfonate transport system permease protein
MAKANDTMSVVAMTIAAEGSPAQERSAPSRRARFIRPALGLIVPVTLALAWEIIVRLGWTSGRLAPPPSVIFWTFVDLARTGELQRDTLVTLSRVAAGFAIGAVVATIVGAVTGYSTTLRRLLDPSLQALRAVPSIAWVPLFILWLGIFEAS